jgi:L-fuculose-phosphate aldolase
MPISYLHPRDEILALMQRIYGYRMTTTSGGNLSIREANGDLWITPARIDKGTLRREDIVCVHPDGSMEGSRQPSSELPLHLAIYRSRPDFGGIVHAHPVALVAFSIAHEVPDTRLFHQAFHVCGKAALAGYELPGSEALGRTVGKVFARGHDSVILENHGVVTGGASVAEAFRRFETLEFTAKTIIKARLVGEVRYLTEAEIALAEQPREPLPEFEPSPPSSAEKELRNVVAAFVRRGYRQRLFISTEGSFSARLAGDSFVITPYRLDRATAQPPELVLVENDRAEAGKTPSRAAAVHAAIYRRCPEVGAIINAYPVNATAFSVTSLALDTRTIPESYVVVRRVTRSPFGLQFDQPEAIAAHVSPAAPAMLLENDGVLATGATVLEAFDRLEVIESTAEALINCRAVGNLAPMPDEAIRELAVAFRLPL